MRASDCASYPECLNLAALADAESFTCPCDKYQHDPESVEWRDVAACQHLILAILKPDAFEVLVALLHTPNNRSKWRLLRSRWPSLHLPKRGIL